MDLDTDDGTHVWEVTVEHGSEDTHVDVDVVTGEVLRVERD